MLNKKAKSKKLRKKVNKIAIVLDVSISMQCVAADTQRMLNSVVDGFKEVPDDQESFVSLYTFGHEVKNIFKDVPAHSVFPITYSPTESATALRDGLGTAIEELQHSSGADHKDTSMLVVVLTDGQDNVNRIYDANEIRREIVDLQATDRWTFVFHCPPRGKQAIVDLFNIPAGNIREWEQTTRGVLDVTNATRLGTQSLYAARSKGASSTCAFFAQPDLGKVAPTVVKQKLDDVSGNFRTFEVKEEARIDEFVSRKTRRDYVIGSAFYQLTKPEKVQASKAVLIKEINGAAVWGGPEARKLIGLPDGQEAKVVPGNHGAYNIFVQSKAPNRQLVRGTNVLVDVTARKSVKPTWDLNTAKPALV